jgi:hypothetical protein
LGVWFGDDLELLKRRQRKYRERRELLMAASGALLAVGRLRGSRAFVGGPWRTPKKRRVTGVLGREMVFLKGRCDKRRRDEGTRPPPMIGNFGTASVARGLGGPKSVERD